MNSLLYRIIIVLLVFLVLQKIQGQYCKEFHKSKYCWMSDAKGFKQYSKARSALMEIKKNYNYEVVLTSRKDFLIGVCTEPSYGPIQYRIIEKATGHVIFDNSTDNYVESIGFSVSDNPLPVIIEVTILATHFTPKDMEDTRTCVGIQIMYQKIAQEGFVGGN